MAYKISDTSVLCMSNLTDIFKHIIDSLNNKAFV